MKRAGGCPCGAVRYSIDGPVRDVLVCHCDACQTATGGPWSASAAHRADLTILDADALLWEPAAVSEYGASRGSCRTCRTPVFWDAPGRETVSFGVATLADPAGLEVAGHIWVAEPGIRDGSCGGAPSYRSGLPPGTTVPWKP